MGREPLSEHAASTKSSYTIAWTRSGLSRGIISSAKAWISSKRFVMRGQIERIPRRMGG